MSPRPEPRGLLLDLDGTVYEDDVLVPGAAEAIEYATGRTATLVGKPSRAMSEAAARSMDLALSEVAVVGDDLQARPSASGATWCRPASSGLPRSKHPRSRPTVFSPPWSRCPSFC